MENELRILHLLEHDAKISAQSIAVMLGLEEEIVLKTIEKLEQEKVILGYGTIINWDRYGENGVTAMIDVKITPEREVGFNDIAKRICRFPEVKSVSLMSGTYDLSIVIAGNDLREVARFISHKLSALDRVQSTTTHFILKSYKQEGFIFEEPYEDKRLVVSP
ncbi:MAG: Lrp/AsnC family transcriptional regulator [Syntrophomonadaceae bacterium]|jgi:DNA-binding Lrp family transcriptional regulator|nr:Lrp/AsnC family transcriptional regulator [Syntrophomonadaceae bacterium]